MDKQTNIALRKTLDQIGASHSLKGYTYTIRAIEKCLDDRDALRCCYEGNLCKNRRRERNYRIQSRKKHPELNRGHMDKWKCECDQ